jgi:putative transposase
VEGVSTRKVDSLLQSLVLAGIDKSQVSRICQELGEAVQAFRERQLAGDYPCVRLDITYLKVRQYHNVVSTAVVVAIGVREMREREILGLAVGVSAEASLGLEFLRGLLRRGLQGVRLAISDAHEGPEATLSQVLGGTAWQRCAVSTSCATSWRT